MSKQLTIGKKDAELLNDILSHCCDHARWMTEVFDNGNRMDKLSDKINSFVFQEGEKK